jgi:plastocyanin
MSALHDDVRRSVAALVGLCGIAAAGLTASCFSERVPEAGEVSCNGTSVPCVVSMRNFAFVPSVLRVPAGATVTWVNDETQVGLAHTSTSDNAGWDSGFLAPGESYSRAFSAAGQFPYHCTPHPTMTATIVVE